MMGHCDDCPDPSLVRSFLTNELQKTIDHEETIRFNQWVSTDRSQLVEEELDFNDFIDLLIKKLDKLTEHNYVAKKQGEYFKKLKENLQFGECVVVLDFAENYSFVVQDAAQSFHWNNSQATIHPFVIYFADKDGKIGHRCYACISDHRTHDTVTVFSFLKHFHEKYISQEFPFVHKIIYFSDGSAAQYKNFKNLTNLIFHYDDFGVQAEWNFYATSHGKNACDGVGGTIKRIAARVSLQRPYEDQILTPKQLFDFAKSNVDGVTSFFVSTEDVATNDLFLQERFATSDTFKGTRSHHRFVPNNTRRSLMMQKISSSIYSKEIQLAAGETDRKPIITIEEVKPGKFYACQYDDDWYFCVANFVSVDHGDVNMKFLHPKGPSAKFFWPTREDVCWIPIEDIYGDVNAPSTGSTGRFYCFGDETVKTVESHFEH